MLTPREVNHYVNVQPVYDEENGAIRMDFHVSHNADETAQSSENAVEADRDHAADPRPQPTLELLMPDLGVFKDRFSLLVSRAVFDGWVTQPSPCCGAASVAGAANAALGLPHDAPAALSHAHINGLYHAMLTDQAKKKSDAVARLLGLETVEPALDALRAELHAEGRSLGGRKELGCKAKEAMLRLRALCEDGGPAGRSEEEEDDGRVTPDAEAQMWSTLWEVMHPLGSGPVKGGEGAEEVEDDENVLDNGGDGVSMGGNGGGGGGGFGAKVRTELKTLLTKLGGLEQLAPSVSSSGSNPTRHARMRSLPKSPTCLVPPCRFHSLSHRLVFPSSFNLCVPAGGAAKHVVDWQLGHARRRARTPRPSL